MSSSQVFQNSDVMALVQSVQAMNQAHASFLKIDLSEREKMISSVLHSFKLELSTHADAIVSTFSESIGVPKRRVLEEMLPTATELLNQVEETFLGLSEKGVAFFPSAGHCAVFLGWTDPLISFVRRIPVLFAAGNAVCLKPSRTSSAAYDLLGKLWHKSLEAGGLQKGLFQILHGAGEGEDQIGELILRHPAMKSIYWIGRTEAALKARVAALQEGKRFFFSGSGRNPAIIFPHQEADIFEAKVRRLADLVLDAHGLGPFRPSRFFVQESIYKQVLEIITDQWDRVQTAGAFAGKLPLKECLRFDRQLKLALSETGKLVTGGSRAEHVIQPTLIRDLTNCSTLQGEELSGPVITAASFKYLHEALKYANTSPLGLSAYLLHPDGEKISAISSKIEASRVITRPEISRSTYLFKTVCPVKQSQSEDDGIDAIFRSSQWRSRVF
ncbi:MAG: aldehyde dehydrogenase family protein [Deltaproteobacteria bacterium]|nr:aldehyde dehydrogenase family protein [Deltaproteobacteria bacterium]